MFAVIEIAGKQYQVKKGSIIEIDKHQGEKEAIFEVEKVLLLSRDSEGKDVSVGQPYVKGVKVKAKVLEVGKAKKVTVLKYKPKKRYRIKKGHRQPISKIEILEIG